MRLASLMTAVLAGLAVPSLLSAADKDTKCYEMRIYYAAEGKLDALNARFKDHTCQLFEKHGMTNVGYWVPTDNKDNKLIYVISYPSKADGEKAWKAFGADDAWKKAKAASEADGKPLVTKVETYFLNVTDYSPPVKSAKDTERVFELRVYTASKGNLDALNARFRDHTVKLFEKHGMTNLWYWNPIKGTRGADDTLVYILAHKDAAAAKASFDGFRKDPDWTKARTASEEKAGGPLTAKDGVQSTFMKATAYSPIK